MSFHLIVLTIDGQTVLTGNTNFVPRIGEKIKSNGYRFEVRDVVYDFGQDAHYGAITVIAHVKLM